MNSIKKYYDEFGLKATYEEGLKRFYNLIDNILPEHLDSMIFSVICNELGLRLSDFQSYRLFDNRRIYFSSFLLSELTKNYEKLHAYRLLITLLVPYGLIKAEDINHIINSSQINLGFGFNEQ